MKHIWKFFILIPITPIIALAAGLTQPKIVEITPSPYNAIIATQIVKQSNVRPAPKTLLKSNPIRQINPEYALYYVVQQSIIHGISPASTTWILGHESQNCQNLVGDDGQSLGCWMISQKYHPEVPLSCKNDLPCSTAWSLNWIKKGNINQWSAWSCRYAWYPDATSTLGPAPNDYQEPKQCK